MRTLVVDDHGPFREVLRHLIAATDGFTVVGEAGSGEDALMAVDAVAPELVLMDVRMPGIGGIEAARHLARRHPEVTVILLSAHGLDELSAELVGSAEAAAFVPKQDLRPHVLRLLWQKSHVAA